MLVVGGWCGVARFRWVWCVGGFGVGWFKADVVFTWFWLVVLVFCVFGVLRDMAFLLFDCYV